MRTTFGPLGHTIALWLAVCAGCSKSEPPPPSPRLVAVTASAATSNGAAKLAWPRTFEDAGSTIAVHQPQVIAWSGDRLQAKSAVSVTPKAGGDTRFGVIYLDARTDVDKPARVVVLRELRVTKASFPQAESSAPIYLEAIRRQVPDKTRVIPLDHLEANLAASQAATSSAVDVKNDPPRIIVATVPTLLVLIDGEPALREVNATVGGARLMRVFNTRALLVFDAAANRYYLRAMRSWVTASSAEGPWAAATQVPPAVDQLKDAFKGDKSVDLYEPTDPAAAPKQSVVLTSTQPAELVQTEGEPQYERVPGTNLMYATNTDGALFKDAATLQQYVLVSGRWFVAPGLQGPWTYVSGKSLPPDFAKIPPDSPKANVLVSVPDTPQAREAVIANSIPQTAAVKISEAKLTVTYDGSPKFTAVRGIKGLQYATNTALPVILVEGDKTFWCVENGVWFTGKSPTGPWAVATEVPGIIYTIPTSNPVHYVTYVRIYGTGPDVVYVGYTPGYMGTCVTADGVVVYGTGHVYPAYVGTVWVGYPPSYGYGASFACGTATGFAFGFAAGASMGYWSTPYWGPCYGYSHIDINTSNVYTNWRGGVTTVNRSYEYDPWDNKAKAKGSFSSFNPYSGRSTVGGYKGSYDYDNNEYSYKRGAATYDPNSGTARAAGSKITGDVDEGTQTVKRGAAEYNENTGVVKGGGSKTFVDADKGTIERETGKFRYNTNTDTGIARKGDDVYVGKDDNVYRHTDDGWQKKTDDGWETAQRDPNRTRELDQQRQSREVGQQRVNSYERAGAYQSSAASRGTGSTRSGGTSGGYRSGGGGGYRGGGGGGRGGGGRR
jgi:hypothetical protein